MNEEKDNLYTVHCSPVNYESLEPTAEYIGSISISRPTSELEEFIKRSSKIVASAKEQYLTIEDKIPFYLHYDDEYGNHVVEVIEVEMKNLVDPNQIT